MPTSILGSNFASNTTTATTVTTMTEEKSDIGPLPIGRFTVTRVENSVPDRVSSGSVIIPISIFDEDHTVLVKEGKKMDKDRISLDEFKTKLMKDPQGLTLYEDNTGKIDTVKGVLMKTVEHSEQDQTTTANKAELGTFLGVFLPCCQNIVGVIYFVRFPWIVGCAGIKEGFLIVSICNMMSICTAISMSAIATNGKLTAGGTYFMISRSLGPTFGGSVGFLFFMGTSISVAMYYLGTVEVLLTYIAPQIAVFGINPSDPMRYNDYRMFGSIQLTCMAVVVFLGVKCVARFACFAIIFLVTALCGIFLGIALASPEGSIKICALGNRLIRHSTAFQNGSWQCHKESYGPIFKAYCTEVNETEYCGDFFRNNEAVLIPGVPGLSLQLFMDALPTFYTEEGNIPGTKIKAKPDYEITTDITTSFVVLIGIYFPSITGVESGSNYSGDLRDAQKSIPLGTVAAVIVTSTIYLGSVLMMGGSTQGLLLRDKYGQSLGDSGDLVLSQMAWPSKWIVLVGTLTATIGAGLQALAGGPRLLQAIAEDNIIPHLGMFAKKWRGEPVRGLIVTYMIAEIGILIAFLDYVAPIVTMFFLMCYGFINFAVTLQSLLDTPHWRPSFKFYHWTLTMFGTALCLVTMFICSWIYALVAITIAFLLYKYIEYKGAEKEWGDGFTGLSMSAALYSLSRMKQDLHHTKNWRPQILVMLKMSQAEEGQANFSKIDHDLVMLADMLKEGKGLTMFATVIKGTLNDNMKRKEKLRQIYAACLENAGVKGFIEVIVSPSVSDGLSCMVQSAGLGALRPNTIIMGWPKGWTESRNIKSFDVFLETMRNIGLARNAAVVLKSADFPSKSLRMHGTLDIWWIVNDGGMLLLIGHLLRRNKTWSKCQLRLFTIALENDNTVQIKQDLQTYLYQLRIEGTVQVVDLAGVEMSAYIYERTLKMEERTRMINIMAKQEHLRRPSTVLYQKIMDREVQNVLENARSMADIRPRLTKVNDDSTPIDKLKPQFVRQENIRHMNTAVRLNAMMKEMSGSASLVILNLPCVPESPRGQINYMSFLEVLTEGIDPLLLVRGTGNEVITVYN